MLVDIMVSIEVITKRWFRINAVQLKLKYKDGRSISITTYIRTTFRTKPIQQLVILTHYRY